MFRKADEVGPQVRKVGNRGCLHRSEIWKAIHTLQQQGCGIMVVDKRVHDIALVAARILFLEKGRVKWQCTPAQLSGDMELQRCCLSM
jgi:ABC-type branched-subunit amino acid transport system ATPase component